MMGSNDKPQDELFYAFNLDDIIPQDHLLRDIDRVLDLLEEPARPLPRLGGVPFCLRAGPQALYGGRPDRR